MKKTTKGFLAVAFAGAMILTGCSTIQPIQNDNKNIIFNGGGVVNVSDYLFYGNGFASGVSSYDTSSKTSYTEAQKYSFLARTDKNDFVGNKYKNENNVDKISDKVTGFGSTYMFVLGDYIYYATPNTHKTNENKYVWSYISIFMTHINGGKTKELFTTQTYDSNKAILRAVSYNNKNYLLIFDGSNLTSIELGKNSVKTLASNITSVALPNENETWNGNVYFTEGRNSSAGQEGNIAYKLNIEEDNKIKVAQENKLTIEFVGRVGNTLFYTQTRSNLSNYPETYKINVEEKQGLDFITSSEKFYPGKIFDVAQISKNNPLYIGYTFSVNVKSGDDEHTVVKYYNEYEANNSIAYECEILLNTDIAYADTVVIYDGYFYYTTSEGMFRKNVITKNLETIVSDISIQLGVYGYDFAYVDNEISRLNNIYFYAQNIEENDESNAGENENTSTKDENYYLYSVEAKEESLITLISKKLEK